MYLQSAWRALGKMYYHLLQIGNVQAFILDDNEKEDGEANFRAKQLLKVTRHLKCVATLFEYLEREVIKTGALQKLENDYYGISGTDIYYKQDSMIEFYDTRFNHFEISTVDYNGTDYYIVDYPLPMLGTTVRVRGYRDDKPI